MVRQRSRLKRAELLLAALAAIATPLGAQATLSSTEQRMHAWLAEHREEQVAYLARVVNIPSGTMNFAGVKRVADVFRATLDSLGFTTRWVPMGVVNRAGHLIAEHSGRPGRPVILLIGHFDTVFEGPGQEWQRTGTDSMARGAGSSDMKGGDVAMLYALKAMQSIGALADANIIAVFTGDEERADEPIAIARKDLMDAGKRAHYALAFEGGNERSAVIARRGASLWTVDATATQAHSSGVFRSGYGAIYELARIINTFREKLAGQPNLTFNPGLIAGGVDAAFDTAGVSATAAGKSNIIAPHAIASGDLRFLTEGQKDSARTVMREIVAQHLSGTSATITFADAYPAMPPTDAGNRLIGMYSEISQALGYRPVVSEDPGGRGAGDISFVAPNIAAALDALGAAGSGSHSPNERVNLNSLLRQTERAALLMGRLAVSRKP